MPVGRAARAALVALLVAVLPACGTGPESDAGSGSGTSTGPGGGTAPEAPLPPDEALETFIDTEQQLDAAELTAALGAGAELGAAGAEIRSAWDDARKRLLSSVDAEGVVVPASMPNRAGAPSIVRLGLTRAEPPLTSHAFFDYDFASMAWSTWSLGLLYVGLNASGTSEHGPNVSGAITATESMTMTAANRGPVASVKLSTTRTLTSTAGWSVTQSGNVELELPLCPDKDGVIAFDVHVSLETRGASGTGATSSVSDTLDGRTVAIVNDDAELRSVETTGSYDHGSSAQGAGLVIAAGESAIHVDVADGGSSAAGSGGATDAEIDEARILGAILLPLAGNLAALRAGDFYKDGYCTEIQVSPDDKPTEVAEGATQPFDVRVRHKWDDVELTDRITAQLDGAESVSPTGPIETPVTLEYVAPNEKNRKATIHVKSCSRRGIARRDVAVKTPGGYAIHDVWQLAAETDQHMDGVNCDSAYGPWHVVISGDLAAGGWQTFNAYYDIVADPETGAGTLHGEEHSVATSGTTYDGPSTGTVLVTPTDDGYLIKLEIDYDITVVHPVDYLDPEQLSGHISRELVVIDATDDECP